MHPFLFRFSINLLYSLKCSIMVLLRKNWGVKMKKKFLIILALVLFLVGCGQKPKEKYSKMFYDTFDTQIQYLEYAESEDKFNENFKFVKEEFTRLHRLYDNYKNYEGINNVKTINDNAGKEPVKVDKDLFELIKFSKENYEKTLGKVNIAMGSVLRIWHDVRENNEGVEESKTIIPTQKELEEANKHTDINAIELNEKDMSVFIKDPEVSIDLGATAKGYAVELISKKLEDKKIESASINAGGNVKTIGKKPDGKPWKIALQNPDLESTEYDLESTEYLDILDLDGTMSVVTSGDYQRFFMHKGKRYHHLIDPKTLQPALIYRSVSIVTEDSGLADLLSTALYLSDQDEAKKILENYKEKINVLWATDTEKWNTEGLDNILEFKNKN